MLLGTFDTPRCRVYIAQHIHFLTHFFKSQLNKLIAKDLPPLNCELQIRIYLESSRLDSGRLFDSNKRFIFS